jgi:hypothetical protein
MILQSSLTKPIGVLNWLCVVWLAALGELYWVQLYTLLAERPHFMPKMGQFPLL